LLQQRRTPPRSSSQRLSDFAAQTMVLLLGRKERERERDGGGGRGERARISLADLFTFVTPHLQAERRFGRLSFGRKRIRFLSPRRNSIVGLFVHFSRSLCTL